MNWDRFDICEAYYCFAVDWHEGQTDPIYQIASRLYRIGFKARPNLSFETLTPNAMVIYEKLIERWGV
jgi:hypothetical protein